MKKIKPTTKLALHAHTLRALSLDQLVQAAGGSLGTEGCSNNTCKGPASCQVF